MVTLVMFAYDVKSYQVAPARALEPFGDTFYDIDARAPGEPPPSEEDFRQMVRVLLEQRFRLRVHREKRDMPVYEMVIAKEHPKIKPAAPDADTVPHNSASGRNWRVTVGSMTMKRLAELVENQGFVGRPVVDKTGLTGNYAIQLIYTPDIPPNRGSDAQDDISIFAALVEQLGLRLEPAKAMVDTIVVDHVEKPSAN